MSMIPFSSPDITEEDLALVSKAIASGWLAHGKYSRDFEEQFCTFTGAPYAVTVSSCTAGLHLSCLAAGIGPGDEVIVPAQSHVATAHAVEYTGARAIFADVDSIIGNIGAESIRAVISKATKGVIVVHLAGYPCAMDAIKELCDEKNLWLMEDCAHSLGTTWNDRHVGNYGICGVFSFYPTKQVTTGEGGMVISNDQGLTEQIRALRAFGIDSAPQDRKLPGQYDVHSLGFNYRMTDFQAALGVGQMSRYEESLSRRKNNAALYSEILFGSHLVSVPEPCSGNSYFVYPILVNNDVNRDKVILSLKSKGVGTSIHYAKTIAEMSYYRQHRKPVNRELPGATEYARKNISLPVHGGLTEENIRKVTDILDSMVI